MKNWLHKNAIPIFLVIWMGFCLGLVYGAVVIK